MVRFLPPTLRQLLRSGAGCRSIRTHTWQVPNLRAASSKENSFAKANNRCRSADGPCSRFSMAAVVRCGPVPRSRPGGTRQSAPGAQTLPAPGWKKGEGDIRKNLPLAAAIIDAIWYGAASGPHQSVESLQTMAEMTAVQRSRITAEIKHSSPFTSPAPD